MTKTMATRGVLLLLTLGLALPSLAQTPFRPRIGFLPSPLAGKPLASITINDRNAMTFRSAAGGATPTQKAQAVASRLAQAISNGLQPGQIVARPVAPNIWMVALTTSTPPVMLTITAPAEAQAQVVSSQKLAQTWAQNLRTLLAQPALTLSTRHLIVPLGEARTIQIGGAARSSGIVVTDGNQIVAQSVFDSGQRLLSVHGLTPGTSQISIQTNENGLAKASLDVDVFKYAAQISPQVEVGVTGTPSAPADIVQLAAYIGLNRAVNAEQNAHIQLLSRPTFNAALPIGEGTLIRMPIRLTGDRLIPVEAKPNIHVTNQNVTMRPATNLFYCNNPEQVKVSQTLFIGGIRPFRPVRLDYHHQNISGHGLVYCIDLVNAGSNPAPVQIIAGCCNPGTDTVQVGRRAGALFMKAFNGNFGVLVTVPPYSRTPIFSQHFSDSLTVSGIIQIQQLDGQGGTLSLQTRAESDSTEIAAMTELVQQQVGSNAVAAVPRSARFLEDNKIVPAEMFSPYVFGAPHVTVTGSYTIGGPWTYLRIGHTESLTDITGKRFLFGNYGVGYDISATLSNPSSAVRTVGLYFAPEAGTAAGVFQVDGGPILELDPSAPPNEILIARYTLAPGETRVTNIKTIPLNGSSYPASLIVHSF